MSEMLTKYEIEEAEENKTTPVKDVELNTFHSRIFDTDRITQHYDALLHNYEISSVERITGEPIRVTWSGYDTLPEPHYLEY